MYARVLRKWSLTKVLMYLWLLPVIMLLVIYCQNATTMHLNGIINTKNLLSSSTSSSSSSLLSTSKIFIKKPATLPQLSSIIQEDDKLIQQQQKTLNPLDNIIINDNQYYYNDNDNDDDYHQQQQQQQSQQNNNLLKSNIPIISNYNHHHKNDDSSSLIDENSSPILITVKTVSSNLNSISNNNNNSISDTIINASANVPNLNSQIINLNNYNNINNNNHNNNNSNNNYNRLTSSANIDTISSNKYNNQNSRSNKFRRHIQQSKILNNNNNNNDDDVIQQQQLPIIKISSTFDNENLLKAQAQQQSSPPYHHFNHELQNSQNLNTDRTKLIINNQQQQNNDMLLFNNDDNNNNREIAESFDQLTPQQERFYELRERRARIEAHRRRLMKLNQLPSTLTSSQTIINNKNNNNSDNNDNKRLLEVKSNQKEIIDKNDIIINGRNRRDSRTLPLHLSSVPSSVQPSYSSLSHQNVLGSSQSSMTMLTVPSVQPSYSSYPIQSNGYYRQQQQQPQPPTLYQHYNNNNNNNNNNMNYNHHNQQQNYQQQQQNQHHNHQQYNNNNNNNNNQHHHQQLQQQQQQQRKRPRRYCSARDPAQLAFEAPTVFEGKIISMSYDRRANFSVTFEVKEIFKKQIGYMLPHLLRLQFTYRNTSGECDIYREYLRPRGYIRGNELEQGRIYILFVQQIDLGNFTILGQPVRKTRRAINSVRKGVSENYAQPAFIRSLTAIANDKRIDNDKRIKNGEELRIICRVSGQPPPKVTWFKDDKSINRNRKLYQFVHLKKRSELIIRSFNSTDAGVYECRAKNKNFRKPERKIIRIESFPRITYESSSQQSGDECTHDMQIYCLNGGTCKFFKEIHDFSCECPDGFFGDRCQEKQWNETPNPTFKTGYMADDPNVFDSDEESLTGDDESST